jgi:hypothetical protein
MRKNMETCSNCGKKVKNVFVVTATGDEEGEKYKCVICFMKDHWSIDV